MEESSIIFILSHVWLDYNFSTPGYVTPFGEFKQSESKPLSSQSCDKHPTLGMTPRGYLLYKENFRLMKVQQNRAQGLGYTVTCLPIRGPYWSPNGLLPVFKKAFDLPGLRCYLKQYVLCLLNLLPVFQKLIDRLVAVTVDLTLFPLLLQTVLIALQHAHTMYSNSSNIQL